jgi:hypothetical protein
MAPRATSLGSTVVCLLIGCGLGCSAGTSAGAGAGQSRDAGRDGSLSSDGAGLVDTGAPDVTLVGDAQHFGQSDASSDAPTVCNAPDLLIVLDHTDSMSDEPNGTKPPATQAGLMLSKWYLATTAVTTITAPPADQFVHFGLELFPLDPDTVDAGGSGHCQTALALLGGQPATNTHCEPAEIAVPPAPGSGSTIASLLDPATSRLCVSTPIALALQTAEAELGAIKVAGRPQYVMLVTDGGETCKGDVPSAAQELAAEGIETFVVGFGSSDAGAGGVNVPLLNDVACAGKTATGFATACVVGDGGGYVAKDRHGPPLFFLAEDGPSLSTALKSIAQTTCCGCAQ